MTSRKTDTMSLKGNQYAKVADRLKLFREDWKDSKIETEHTYLDGGLVEFKAWVWKDKQQYINMLKEVKDLSLARGSADADGNSKGKTDNEKDFEKLQTIAVGRALALLGYLSSGDVASFEEMEMYDQYKTEQHQASVKTAIATFDEARDLNELKAAFIASGLLQDPDVVAAKDKRKAELMEVSQES